MRRGLIAALLAALSSSLIVAAGPSSAAQAKFVSKAITFRSTDGTMLPATIGGFGSLRPRPVIVEDSPYSPAADSISFLGSAYNYIELQWRGTGLSGGALSTTGPEDQRDLSAFLGWACKQPWSNGNLGIYGFSASAIVAYNTMHLPMPCVKAASLMAGSVDLYRDLLDIGGIPNLAAGAFVETAIGGPTLLNGPQRTKTEPETVPEVLAGYPAAALDVLSNPTESKFWRERTFRGDRDHIPLLIDSSFYDVETRGPFLAYNATKRYGSHLLVYGAHDGHPAGTPGPFPQYANWFDHYLRSLPLSAANQTKVSLYLSNGSRQAFLANHVTHLTGTQWPLRGTRWTPLYFSVAHSGSITSINDGSLALTKPSQAASQSYPFIPSVPTETSPHTIGVIAGTGLDQAAGLFPALTDMELSGPTSLTYTTTPLKRALNVVGPTAADVWMSSTTPVTDIYLVLADVQSDGTAYPIGTGSLRTAYPNVNRARSLVDRADRIVDPYNIFASRNPATIGTTRHYQVEFLPLGNHFAKGDRIRLYVLGTPAEQLGSLPGIDTVRLGGAMTSRLLLPSVGNDSRAALRPTRGPHVGQHRT